MIFVAGLARSGTTLFQTIFCRHPGVFSFPETHFFEAVAKLHLYGRSLTDEELERLGREIIGRGGLDDIDWLDVRKRVKCAASSRVNVGTVFLSLIENYRQKGGHDRSCIVLEKTPGHVFQLPQMLSFFPDAHVFLMRRNPRDYANSIAKCSWSPGSIKEIGKLWSATINTIHSCASLYQDRVMIVDYEDLVREPENIMLNCFSHAGLAFDCDFLTGLDQLGHDLVRKSEISWKSRNVTQSTVVDSPIPVELSLKQRVRLMLALSPFSIARYGTRNLRF